MKNKKRAIRRHHRERLIQKYIRLEFQNDTLNLRKPEPHKYFAYNLDNSEDFRDFLSEDLNPKSRKKIYVIGKGQKGCVNPYPPVIDLYGREHILSRPAYDWEEVFHDVREDVSYYWNTPKRHSGIMCGNPRKHLKRKTIKEIQKYLDVKDDLEDYGFILPKKKYRRY